MDWTHITLICCLVLGGTAAKKPTLRPAQESVEKFQNGSYVVLCESDKDEKLSWTGPGGRVIPLSPDSSVHAENKPGLGQALLLDHIGPADQGRYTCTSSSKETVSFSLSVVRTSTFKNTPIEQYVNELTNTTIKCEVEGEPKPIISWQRDKQLISPSPGSRYIPDAKGLKIVNATKKDSGIFTCRAVQMGNEDSSIKTIDISLKVLHKPEWREPDAGLVQVFGYIGGETNLTCEAVAQPEAAYMWLRNNKDVKLQTNVTELIEFSRSVLQIQIANESFFGRYECQAKNNLGHISRIFDLQRGEKPAPPTSIEVVKVTVHTATFSLKGGSDRVGFRAQFVISRPGQEIDWTRSDYQDLTKTDGDDYVIRDLLEDTPYTVRAAVRSPAGLSDYSNATVLVRTAKTGEVRDSALKALSCTFLLVASLYATQMAF